MGLEDLTTLDATYPKGHIEPVSVLDNYQRETRAKLKAWAAVEHDLATGQHKINTLPNFPVQGRMYYDQITSELRYYMNGPPGHNFWRSVIQPPFNYIYNPEFKLMSNGNNSPPSGWGWSALPGQLIGTDTVAISASKTSIFLVTPSTAGPSDYNLLAQAMSTSNPRFLPIDYWRGRTISLGCYVLSDIAGAAWVQLHDGVQYISSNGAPSGPTAWDWCVTTMTVSSGATDIQARLLCGPTPGTTFAARFSMPTLVEGAWCPRPLAQGHPQRSTIVSFSSLNSGANTMIGTNYYGPVGRSTNEFLASIIIPYRFQARNLSVQSNVFAGVGQSYNCRVRYNNAVDSNITCTITGTSSNVGLDDVNTLTGDANGTLSLRVIGSAAAPAAGIFGSLYVDELPW